VTAAATDASGPRILDVDPEQQGQRLDNFLLARLKGVPRSYVYRIIRSGEVRINSRRARPATKIEAGDRVRVPPVRTSVRAAAATPSDELLERLESRILFEDDALLVIDKPAGLAVHGGSGIRLGLIEALRVLRPERRQLELVHRLDRDTSGCLMVAGRRAELRHLHDMLREGRLHKRYLALVHGRWPRRRVKVSAPLQRSTGRGGERLVRADHAGREALTRFEVQRHYRDCSLVAAEPVTGRTHQIRVHAAVSGHPIAGDPKYGEREFNRVMRERGLRRLFLHAAELRIERADGSMLDLAAPLDPALQALLDRLEPPDAADL
jgi:23S rRNA pseudouridine955/2504/2580 synthase